jgi:hypothetical protein
MKGQDGRWLISVIMPVGVKFLEHFFLESHEIILILVAFYLYHCVSTSERLQVVSKKSESGQSSF